MNFCKCRLCDLEIETGHAKGRAFTTHNNARRLGLTSTERVVARLPQYELSCYGDQLDRLFSMGIAFQQKDDAVAFLRPGDVFVEESGAFVILIPYKEEI